MADDCDQYILRMLDHIYKEDNILYPLGETRFTQENDEKLYQDVETLETEKIGTGRHDDFHQMIDQLTQIYLD